MLNILMDMVNQAAGAFYALVVISLVFLVIIIVQAVMLHRRNQELNRHDNTSMKIQDSIDDTARSINKHKLTQSESLNYILFDMMYYIITNSNDGNSEHTLNMLRSKITTIEMNPQNTSLIDRIQKHEANNVDLFLFMVQMMDSRRGSNLFPEDWRERYTTNRDRMVTAQTQINGLEDSLSNLYLDKEEEDKYNDYDDYEEPLTFKDRLVGLFTFQNRDDYDDDDEDYYEDDDEEEEEYNKSQGSLLRFFGFKK